MFETFDFSRNGTKKATIYDANENETKFFIHDAINAVKANCHEWDRVFVIGNKRILSNFVASFDIETTTFPSKKIKSGEVTEAAYAYSMQFALNEHVLIMRTWEQVRELFKLLIKALKLSKRRQLYMLVHNLSYEYSFWKYELCYDDYFGRSRRKPITMMLYKHIFVQDSQALTRMSLKELSENFNKHFFKMSDFSYDVKRTPSYKLSYADIMYMSLDVLCLTEYGKYLFEEYFEDDFMPITANQIVHHSIVCALRDKKNFNDHFLPKSLIDSLISLCDAQAQEECEKLGVSNSKEYDSIYRVSFDKIWSYYSKLYISGYLFGYPILGGYKKKTFIEGLVQQSWWRKYDIETGKELSISTEKPQNLYKWLFIAGYSHANLFHKDKLLTNIDGYDITSAYPYSMLAYKHVVGKFLPVIDEKERNHYIYDYKCEDENYEFENIRWMACIELTNLSANILYNICIIPENKICAENRHSVAVENGCVRHVSGKCMICVTDVLWDSIKMFYTWSELKVCWLYKARAGKLPDYLRTPLIDAYSRKAQLKADGKKGTPEYKRAKFFADSLFGDTCKSPEWSETKTAYNGTIFVEQVTDRVTGTVKTTEYDDNNDPVNSYEEENIELCMTNEKIFGKTCILSPFWGVWTAAFIRWEICKLIFKISKNSEFASDWIYTDTDCLYFKNPEKHKKIIDDFNEYVYKRLERFLLPEQLIWCKDLGSLSSIPADETHGQAINIKRFKVLGSKRYLKSYEIDGVEDIHAVISGLPSQKTVVTSNDDGTECHSTTSTYIDYCKKIGVDPFEFFQPGFDMTVNGVDFYDVGLKVHTYIDEPCETDYNGEHLTTKSCTVLNPKGFKTTLNDIWLSTVDEVEQMEARNGYD